ncbi:MAG: aminotransferase class I/II-fold pyridoxal phosphate-dependent enzyme [Polyangiaceae bacterium]|nr:aminotransferase class I/II-fold pyridoxal phosphate-dependent enzyme [Polyangiaceae bacterium]
MREAMARADVGDDVYGEDPTARALEERMISLTGKEAALFVPSGTMGNQLALLASTRRGDEIVIGEGAHMSFYESGAAPALSGVQFAVAGQGGLFDAAACAGAIKPDAYYHPRTSLVAIENTHNRAGGRVFPQADVLAIAELARARGLALHCDGARAWNASVRTGLSMRELLAPFDTASVCFSKGLGAPVGSMLVGDRDRLRISHRHRKMLGAGMRQVGVLAAAALFALDHNLPRLAEDHARARRLAARLSTLPGVDVPTPETNRVMAPTRPGEADCAVAAARAEGVLVSAFSPSTIRLVVHLDIDDDAVERAAVVLSRALTTPG